MKISLTKAGKRFNREWIFRNLSYEFTAGNSYAIVGPNGSGKSTLLQAIGGALMLSEGDVVVSRQSLVISQQPQDVVVSRESSVISQQPQNVVVSRESLVGSQQPEDVVGRRQSLVGSQHPSKRLGEEKVGPEDLYRSMAIAAPYLELIEELSVTELLTFHQQFKPFLPQVSINDIIRIVGLEKAAHKQIRYYSSGMKQRVKLAQAIFSDVPLLLLDEPCTNLDAEGIQLYQSLINDYCLNRLVIVSSNDVAEYGFCKHKVNIMEHKM